MAGRNANSRNLPEGPANGFDPTELNHLIADLQEHALRVPGAARSAIHKLDQRQDSEERLPESPIPTLSPEVSDLKHKTS